MFFVFMAMVMMGLSGSSLGTGTNEHHNHNGDNHDDLCSVLKAAVTLYHSRRSGEKLRKALKRAIFGNESGGGDIETLQKGLPETHNNPGNRKNWCGDCTYGGDHYPGKSIPHDLICMCTVGSSGFPFTHMSENGKTLCGKSATDLGCEKNRESGTGCHGKNNSHWWNDTSTNHEPNGKGQVKEHLETTWNTVVKPCLQGRHIEQAKKTLLEKLYVGHQSSPSWARGHTNCGGDHSDVCVSYGHQCHDNPNSPQWWQELYDALTTTEDTSAQGNSTRSPRKRTRRKTGSATAAGEPEDDSEEDEPENTGTTSTSNRPLPLLSNQQSGILLTKPLLCLLSASFFI
ncbi:Variant surface glycoprotein [Trypanosoma congolense IL3000]|uniref:Variant surface glycoprotein n=1 Tax=Trypanosoma congolense (strain IL3000) TaxID=1068625 RepID=F9WG43_TRYCI|nr:Variant surface glycoprotein [Trypanosoma congolense IL3000]